MNLHDDIINAISSFSEDIKSGDFPNKTSNTKIGKNFPIKQLTNSFEDNHIIVVNKRCGDIVQGDKTGDTPLSEIIKSYIKEKYKKPGNVYLGVPHRLDRPTSGVLIFAKTSKSLKD